MNQIHSTGGKWTLFILLSMLTALSMGQIPSVSMDVSTSLTETSQLTPSSTFPSPSMEPSPPPLPTSPPPLHPTPTPTATPPPPSSSFLDYRSSTFYVGIEKMSVTYDGITRETGYLRNYKVINTVESSSMRLSFKRNYTVNGVNQFYIAFTFERDSAHPDTWYILNFQHMNETEDEEGEHLFQYRGIKFSISAPMKKGYTCTIMDQHGTAGASGESTDSVLIFEGINIQAFIKDGHLNRESVSCSDDAPAKRNVVLVTSVILGTCAFLVVIVVIIIVIVFYVKSRRRGYNLLKD